MNYRPELTDEILDELMKGYQKPEDLLGEGGLLKVLTKRLLERAMDGELTAHLGYEKHTKGARENDNARNGSFKKVVKGDHGELEIRVPRDRNGEFKPEIIKKGQTRFAGFDEKIIALYGRGMTTREIRGFLEQAYGVDVSPGLISQVTETVMDDVDEWRKRPLEKLYATVWLDAMFLKCRKNGRVESLPLYLAQGVNADGYREVLGMWIMEQEGAGFWRQVLTDLRNRGVEDILIACVDGLKGFPDAIRATFPKTEVQRCVVHSVRHCLKYVSYQDRKAVAGGLREVYTAVDEEQALQRLEKAAEAWEMCYPAIYRHWRQNWDELATFFKYPPEIRRVIYTTNPMEALNRQIRKITKNRSVFPNQKAILKLTFLALENITAGWGKKRVPYWSTAISQFAILFENRFNPV